MSSIEELAAHLARTMEDENELARILALYGERELAVWVIDTGDEDGNVKVQVFKLSGSGGTLRADFVRSKTDRNVVHALQFIADKWLPEISAALDAPRRK